MHKKITPKNFKKFHSIDNYKMQLFFLQTSSRKSQVFKIRVIIKIPYFYTKN